MRRLLIIAALAGSGCDDAPRRGDQEPAARAAPEVIASGAAQSRPPAVVPRPGDQAKLDDMILAGYTPHADHLHAPGVNSCPLTKDGDAVM